MVATAPAATMAAAEGAAFDAALGLMTSENPQQLANASAFGTLFGIGRGAFVTSRNLVSGQIVTARAWGSVKETPFTGQFPQFERMQRNSVANLAPAEQLRLNALREFASRMDTELFYGTEAEMAKALQEAGYDPGPAQQAGFFTGEMKGRDGKPKRVMMVTEVGAAPHEALHAIENVIGEAAMRKVDQLVQQTYAAHRLGEVGKLQYGDAAGVQASGRENDQIGCSHSPDDIGIYRG